MGIPRRIQAETSAQGKLNYILVQGELAGERIHQHKSMSQAREKNPGTTMFREQTKPKEYTFNKLKGSKYMVRKYRYVKDTRNATLGYRK